PNSATPEIIYAIVMTTVLPPICLDALNLEETSRAHVAKSGLTLQSPPVLTETHAEGPSA
ncbi:hypothetical protein, partial [Chamaesiphon sp. OTE_8_metabat_110]|uniref:hypothetical protein n=1 Tax=Chamaesiphon sp. OTE_8_metabat_110 TaxID=2964696 RepID=UPI00286C6B0D